MNTSNLTTSIYKKLFDVQGDLKPVLADSTNPHYKSKYADLESIWTHVSPVLQTHGVLVIQGCEVEPSQHLFTRLVCKGTGEWVESRTPLILGKQDPQGIGSAFTYYRRYALAAMLGLVQTDDDANAAMPKQAQNNEAEKKYNEARKLLKDAKTGAELAATSKAILPKMAQYGFTQDMKNAITELVGDLTNQFKGAQ